MKGIKRIRLVLKRIFCAKERKTVDLEQEVYRIIKNRDVCKMIGLIQNGLDVNMPIRKSSVYFDWISSQMVLRPKDVVLNYPNEAMLLLLRGMNAKTQNEMLEFEEMQRIWDWAFSVYNDENNKRNLSIKCIEDYMELVLEPIVQLEEQTKVCSAGTRSSISVGVTGDILPCHQRHTVAEYYKDLVIGNINSDEVREVKFNNQTIASIDNCDDCIAKAVCKGGCPSENLTQNKNGNLMNHTQCEVLRRMVAVAMLYQYKLVNGELKNIRSRRLNVLSENLKLLSMLQSLLFEEKNVEETEIALVKFYEKLSDIQDILLPSFSTVIKIVTDEMVNNVSSELKNMDE